MFVLSYKLFKVLLKIEVSSLKDSTQLSGFLCEENLGFCSLRNSNANGKDTTFCWCELEFHILQPLVSLLQLLLSSSTDSYLLVPCFIIDHNQLATHLS